MNIVKIAAGLAMITTLAACDGTVGPDKSRDRGFDRKSLSQLQAGIWVDPNGCDHWIIDDGLEGYLSQRLDKYGKPVCSEAAPPNTAVGPFKGGSGVPDSL
ncbi:hypothetical protein M8756_12785 [Lutimaribacter sp. EGI FJ00015]|uniref:Uncharacterized protein n=1 Tax=Lutimaribacter degradans TaxID=2945989 RepID=A0ACC5ZXE1_9RHOB|nr:hypothetical protein [Lutimaribacter sp. EGI FJ00013]MCM2563018.1 hypothetical protein [Lutimaribacter sp. EGI FJ00013]MCO0614186.1 hypothetical protein [Lutimaribacter sp. EGI FJ00015]MCO0636163.1 hypothetical protein [Lutimaribacter sp. EGI FJ00014]